MRSIFFSSLMITLATWCYGQQANTSNYANRVKQFIATAQKSPGTNTLVLSAYLGNPLNRTDLNTLLTKIPTSKNPDFDIIKLIRILNFTNGEYDSLILNVLDDVPFWLEKNEDTRVYWSENHMIMWTSSAWLLHEKYGWKFDDDLETRLLRYLNNKIIYGYYEFFSSVYFPYAFGGLLNLIDFAKDPTVRSLATQAADRLLSDIMLLVNNKGTFFPVAGRNYFSKYASAYGNESNNIIWLLTGLGQAPSRGGANSCMLATSGYDITTPVKTWSDYESLDFDFGHDLNQGPVVFPEVTKEDRIIFQWSYGGYFHPDLAADTKWLLDKYNLWNHPDFDDFSMFSGVSSGLVVKTAKIAAPITRSSVISTADIEIYKNKGITLSSAQSYRGGYLGYQQWPWMANIDTVAVWTQSGEVFANWKDRSHSNSNTHLPYLKQDKNIALIMYRPIKDLALYGFGDFDVALYWSESSFEETRTYGGRWLMGRVGDSYVAVRRGCDNGMINGWPACSNDSHQAWGVVVGNAKMYGSFDNFERLVKNATFEEKWKWNLKKASYDYHAKIVFDKTAVEHTWSGR